MTPWPAHLHPISDLLAHRRTLYAEEWPRPLRKSFCRMTLQHKSGRLDTVELFCHAVEGWGTDTKRLVMAA